MKPDMFKRILEMNKQNKLETKTSCISIFKEEINSSFNNEKVKNVVNIFFSKKQKNLHFSIFEMEKLKRIFFIHAELISVFKLWAWEKDEKNISGIEEYRQLRDFIKKILEENNDKVSKFCEEIKKICVEKEEEQIKENPITFTITNFLEIMKILLPFWDIQQNVIDSSSIVFLKKAFDEVFDELRCKNSFFDNMSNNLRYGEWRFLNSFCLNLKLKLQSFKHNEEKKKEDKLRELEQLGNNYYKLLEVEEKANLEEIKKCFQKKREWLFSSKNDELLWKDKWYIIIDGFSLITEAFCVLSHPKLKKNYDEYLEQGKEDIFIKYIGSQFSYFVKEYLLIESWTNKNVLTNFFSNHKWLQEKVLDSFDVFRTIERKETQEIKKDLTDFFEREVLNLLFLLRIRLEGFFTNEDKIVKSFLLLEGKERTIGEVFLKHIKMVATFKRWFWKRENSKDIEGRRNFTELRVFNKIVFDETRDTIIKFYDQIVVSALSKNIKGGVEMEIKTFIDMVNSMPTKKRDRLSLAKKEFVRNDFVTKEISKKIDSLRYGDWEACYYLCEWCTDIEKKKDLDDEYLQQNISPVSSPILKSDVKNIDGSGVFFLKTGFLGMGVVVNLVVVIFLELFFFKDKIRRRMFIKMW